MEEPEDKPLISEVQNPNGISAIIDRIGFGRYQVLVTSTLAFFLFIDGVEAALITIVSYILEEEWSLSSTELGVLGGVILLGMSVGYCTSGLMEARFGRLKTIYLGLVAVLSFGILSAFMPELWSLAFSRMFVGYGIGVSVPVGISLGTEINPTSGRGFSILLILVMFPVGQMFFVSLAMLITPELDSSNWRILVLIAAVPAIATLVLVYFFAHESPLYLARSKVYEDAVAILGVIAKTNNQPELTQEEVDGVYSTLPNSFYSNGSTLERIYDKWHRSLSIKVQVIVIGVCVVFYGIVFTFPYIIDADEDAFLTLIYMLVSYAAQIPCVLLTMYIIEKKPFGRKNTAIITLAVISVLSVILILSGGTLQLVLILVAQGLANSVFSLFYLYVPEVYETELRTTALGLVNTLGRLVGSLGVYWYFFLLDQSTELVFGFNTILATATTILALTLPFDTMGRRLDASL